MKKDLLFIAHRIPYPPDKGDKIRTYNFLDYLSRHYRVTVACIIDDPADIDYVAALRQRVHQIFYQLRSASQMKKWAIGALISGRSVTQHCFYAKELQQKIDDYLDQFDPVAIISFCSSTADYLFRSRHPLATLQDKVLLNDLIDVDSVKWSQYAEKHSGFMGWIYRREARLLATSEEKIVASFDRTFLVSEEERTVLAQHASVEKVEALSNGVDLNYFSPDKVDIQQQQIAECKLVFSGAMDYWPNVEGAVWFAEKIFPLIKQAVPQAIFCVAGRNPTEQVLALKEIPGVEVTGTVPDMRDHLATATICVVPLKIARGIQNKVLEAMAMAKPVIATSGAATGTKAVNGEELIIADDERQMANEIITLLADAEKRNDIGLKAREYVEREHSWETHLRRLVEIIEAGKG